MLTVISSGPPRTGTLSLKVALTEPRFGPGHRAMELAMHPESFVDARNRGSVANRQSFTCPAAGRSVKLGP